MHYLWLCSWTSWLSYAELLDFLFCLYSLVVIKAHIEYNAIVFCFRSKVMFRNNECEATVEDVASSFSSRGMLWSSAAEVALYCLRAKYQGSDKLILPYWVCVSQPYIIFQISLNLSVSFYFICTSFVAPYVLFCCYLHYLRTRFTEGNLIPVWGSISKRLVQIAWMCMIV